MRYLNCSSRDIPAAPENINGEDDTPFDIYELDFSGKKNLVYKHKLENSEQSRSQLEAVVEYVDKYCKADGVKTAGYMSACAGRSDCI